jgi:hypothetical protein
LEPGRSDPAPQPLARGAGAAKRNAGASCATMLAGRAAVSAAAIHSALHAHSALDVRIRLRKGFGPLRRLVRRGESAERNNPDDRGRRCLRVPLAKQTLLLILNFSTAPGELDWGAQLTTSSGELDMPDLSNLSFVRLFSPLPFLRIFGTWLGVEVGFLCFAKIPICR